MSYAVRPSAETCRGACRCEISPVTCGADRRSFTASSAAASNAGVPARSVVLWRTTATTDGG
jgi:hypothetical protein